MCDVGVFDELVKGPAIGLERPFVHTPDEAVDQSEVVEMIVGVVPVEMHDPFSTRVSLKCFWVERLIDQRGDRLGCSAFAVVNRLDCSTGAILVTRIESLGGSVPNEPCV